MKFKITYTLPNGDEDYFIIEGDDMETIREKAAKEIKRRGISYAYSEEIKDGE